MQHKKLVLILGLFFLANCSYRATAFDSKESQKFSVLLPVNDATSKVIKLGIDLPRNFRSVYSLEQVVQSGIQEYVPKTESLLNWSEMIIVRWSSIVNTGFSISSVTAADQMRIAMLRQGGPNVEELLRETKEHTEYTTSKFMLAYNDPLLHGGRAVMYAEYASGPYVCSGVHYTVAVTDGMTEKDAVEKVNAFVKNNISIINT